MHDLTLGRPVDTGDRDPAATHRGNCTDSVFGCIRCWNSANDGHGTYSDCDWCGREDLTLVLRDYEEPVLYALCPQCQIDRDTDLNQLLADQDDLAGY